MMACAPVIMSYLRRVGCLYHLLSLRGGPTKVRPERNDLGLGGERRMSSVPIAEHAILSDCHSAALVTSAGSVDWLCCPRFDSPSVFARLLDDRAGHFAIHPVAEY